jgi:hypothetical protein
MKKVKGTRIIILVAFVISVFFVKAQENAIHNFFPDIKVLASNNPADGYFFMGSKGITVANGSHYIAIIDNYGTPIFFRKMSKATSSFRVLPNGKLAYMHGVPRKWYLLNDMLNIEETINVIDYKPNGHDWDFDGNGYLLLMGQAESNFDMSSIVEGGNANAQILDLIVQEFDENFNLIYTWNSANHFNILDGNEKSSYVDFTEEQIDYVHANAICVDSDTSFLISNRHMDEITKVDRRTGEIIWRLGGKNNQFTFINDELRFSHQHSIRSLGNGHFLLFDNGNLHNSQISSSVEYVINETEKTATLVKRYNRNPNVYSNHGGATQRVNNGNTIISWGPYWPSVTEFHPDGSTALEWDFTKHSFSPRIEKYKWETKVFETNLSEVNFGTYQNDTLFQVVSIKNNSTDSLAITTLDKHTNYFGITNQLPFNITPGDSVNIKIWYKADSLETGIVYDLLTLASDTENQRIARQIKVTGKKADNTPPVAKLITPNLDFPLNGKIEIEFSEPIFKNGLELNYQNIDSLITLQNNQTEENIDFNATIGTNKKSITIIPENQLQKATTYKVTIEEGLADISGNLAEKFIAVFSTLLTNNMISEMNHSLNVYPNPAKDKLFIEPGNINGELSYRIYNINGGLMFEKQTKNIQKEELNLLGYKPGIYFIHLQIGNIHINQRIVKY